MQKYDKHVSTKKTPQSEKIPGSFQAANSAGGFSFAVIDWDRLDRFLVLGSEGGSYYASEQKLTVENAEAVQRCIKEDGERVVRTIVQISEEGRAAKNDPALFALAMCMGMGDLNTRRAAYRAVTKVARIGTHLFHLVQYTQAFKGWSRGLRRAVGNAWYELPPTEKVAFQMLKYQQRDGWSHRDLLRLAHPGKHVSDDRRALFSWVAHPDQIAEDGTVDITRKKTVRDSKGRGEVKVLESARRHPLPTQIVAASRLKADTAIDDAIKLIKDHRLPREVIPTELMNEPRVWEALLPDMPYTALMRNLNKLTQLNVIRPGDCAAVVDKLTDEEIIGKARVHPLNILMAQRTYAAGQGIRGSLTWAPVPEITDALDEAFYKAFKNVEPTGKRHMLALDVSGSMGSGLVGGTPLNPREAAAAMAAVTLNVESACSVVAFSTGSLSWSTEKSPGRTWFGSGIEPMNFSRRQRLDDIVRATSGLPFGRTDCALPMLYALEKNLEVDAFVILTDSETWAGNIHPIQALNEYRNKMGIPAKLVVVGMVANQFSIADPNDAGMLDVVGFDSAAPSLIADFVKK